MRCHVFCLGEGRHAIVCCCYWRVIVAARESGSGAVEPQTNAFTQARVFLLTPLHAAVELPVSLTDGETKHSVDAVFEIDGLGIVGFTSA